MSSWNNHHQEINIPLPSNRKSGITRYIILITLGLIILSSMMALVFQSLTKDGRCFSKISIICAGNLIFWAAVAPLIVRYSNHIYNKQHYLLQLAIIGLPVLTANQLLIRNFVNLTYSIGFCTDYKQDWHAMLFENNLLTNLFTYVSIVVLVITKKRRQFAAASDSVIEAISEDLNAAPTKPVTLYPEVIPVKNGSTITRVNVCDIVYIEANNNTISIFVNDRKHVLYRSLSSIQEDLDPKIFIRIHRSCVVNKSKVQKISSQPNGDAVVQLEGGALVRMSRHYRAKTAVLG